MENDNLNYEAMLRALINSMRDIYQEGRASALCDIPANQSWEFSAAKQFQKVLEEKLK